MELTIKHRKWIGYPLAVCGLCLALLVASPFAAGAPAAAGDLDASFGRDGVVLAHVEASLMGDTFADVVVQDDGKIVVITEGDFVLARFNPDGSLDGEFGNAGIVQDYSPGLASAVALQSDGKILVAGESYSWPYNSFALARYMPDGSWDMSFGDSGLVETKFGNKDSAAYEIVVQPDGKIVVTGRVEGNGGHDFALARYLPNGSLDTTFSSDGKTTADFGGDEDGWDAVLQSDGKIVVLGDEAAARFNPDGSLDLSFSQDGKIDFPGNADGWAIAITREGKIIVTGSSFTACYQEDGSLDGKFGAAGVVQVGGLAVEVQGNGAVLVADFVDPDILRLWRLNGDGSLDETFGDHGVVDLILPPDPVPYALALQSDEKILLAGGVWDAHEDGLVVRYNVDGSLDASFAEAGVLRTSLTNSWDEAEDLALQSDGKLLVVGSSDYNYYYTGMDFFTMRFNPDGSPDQGFGSQGVVEADFSGRYDHAQTVIVQSDDRIIVVGSTYNTSWISNIALVRYLPDGSPDASFDGDGRVITSLGASCGGNAAAIQADGKIVVAGFIENTVQKTNFAVLRYLPDGSRDASFGSNGSVITDFSQRYDAPAAVAIQPDGKILVAGYSGSGGGSRYDFALARYNADGSPDSSFGSAGKVLTVGSIDGGGAQAMALQPDGKIVLAGTVFLSTEDFGIVRYNPDGSLDTTFDMDGIAALDFNGGVDYSTAVALQNDGKILAAGAAQRGGEGFDFGLLRLNLDGSLDVSFGVGGKIFTPVGGGVYPHTNVPTGMLLQADGRIVIAGRVERMYDSEIALLRYLNDYSPTAVTVAAFEAVSMPGRVQLTWQTVMETNLLGFNLYRSESPDGPRTRVNPALIPARFLLGGSTYTAFDPLALPGRSYYYWLELIDIHNQATEELGPEQVFIQYFLFLPMNRH